MLTRFCLCSMVSSAIIFCCESKAFADGAKTSSDSQQKYQVNLLIDPPADTMGHDDYSYRKTNYNKTVSVMLYGFRDQPDTPVIAKTRKSLGSFFKQHLDRIKEDVFSKDPNSLHLMTGERAFNSTEINRGIGLDPAKMVGMTAPYGHLTFGAGYTWGEKNPALMRRTKAEGFFSGVSYDLGKMGYQISYLRSGDRVGGVKMGGSTLRYDSLMFGTSFRVTERLGLTATMQFRKDDDPLTTGSQQTIFTVGTKWKF